MGTYLEDYLESIYMLPSDIRRNFDLMRELDKTSYQFIDDLKSSHKKYLIHAREKVIARYADQNKEEPTEEELKLLIKSANILETLKEQERNVCQKLDEKIAIAAQSYDLVDHHIRRLDQDLEAFAAILKQNGEFEDDDVQEERIVGARKRKQDKSLQDIEKANMNTGQHVHKKQHVIAQSNLTRKKSTGDLMDHGHVDSESVAQLHDDMAIDPNEPLYCHCRRVSFGQMVGCDNEDCRYEWFHFECVGLTERPPGKWFCSECKEQICRDS